MINVREITIRCGRCHSFQTLTAFRPGDERNVYVYECDHDGCPTDETRTLVEVPRMLDEFAQRHPDCGGGCGSAAPAGNPRVPR